MAQIVDRHMQHRPVILIAEDEPTIRAVLARVLESEGYHVLTAENGRSALMLIATLNLPVDLVVSDLTMPEVGGEALIAELARYQRMPPVLFISGLGRDDVPGLSLPLLRKPFTTQELCARVRQLLGRPPASQREASRTA
jgi:DNA-binding response OmpR family regulator